MLLPGDQFLYTTLRGAVACSPARLASAHSEDPLLGPQLADYVASTGSLQRQFDYKFVSLT